MKKLGVIVRSDNSGLGTLSQEFYNNLKVEKVLIVHNKVYQSFDERFPNAIIVDRAMKDEKVEEFIKLVDNILSFETFYDGKVVRLARKHNKKTILIPMYECTPSFGDIGYPDVLLCPSRLDLQFYQKYRKDVRLEYLPIPVNRDKLVFKSRKQAKIFLHNAGHGGLLGRNGTNELLAAIPMVQSDVKFIINTQRPLKFSHPKLTINVGNYKNYNDLWSQGDVFIQPHKFNGLSLPIQEALSVGMPVLTTYMFPFNAWLPTHWLINPEQVIRTRVSNTVRELIDYAVIQPETIAKKIDEFANKDITKDSALANDLAGAISWSKLKTEYERILYD